MTRSKRSIWSCYFFFYDTSTTEIYTLSLHDALPICPYARGVEAAGLHPAPDLRARDLGGGGVLHQVVDRGRAHAVQPRVEIADADRHVLVQPGVGDLAARHGEVEQLTGG